MAKVSGTYTTLSRGVSQQVPEARLDGQHWEQVNMWTDPVSGLVRRRGTVQQDAGLVNTVGSFHSLTAEQKAELKAYFAAYRTAPYTAGGSELVIHYPTLPKPTWADFTSQFPGGIWAAKKVQPVGGAQIVSIKRGAGTALAQLAAKENKGFAAACQVGRYFMLYPNNTPFTHSAEVDTWQAPDNNVAVVQIKMGVPNRQYSLFVQISGIIHTFTYTTPSSSYSGELSTADIAYSDPEYAKKVNDRVNAYNSAVTQWITTAAAQTRPAYIATKLAEAASGSLGSICQGSAGSAVLLAWSGSTYLQDVAASDSGDDSQVAVTFDVVKSIDDLTSTHYTGKVVKVQPGRGTAAFYMRAVGAAGVIGWTKVRWEECPRTTQAAPAFPMVVLAVNESTGPDAGKLFAAASPALLSSLMPGDPGSLPDFGTRLVGDSSTSPAPRYVNRQVNYMGMFQDRLLLAVGNVLCMSEVGNYFNFWRTETLTVPDRDPVEIYALGAEDDVIRHGVLFDRSLLLFGERQQYVVPGQNPITPSTSTVIQSGAIEDSVDAAPVTGGNLVFFGKRRELSTEVFQIAVGDVSDTTNYIGLGLQLLDYIPGKPAQFLHVSSPSLLFVRTDAAPYSLFVFRYIDQGRDRVLDSWSRFDYGEAFGQIVGMFLHDDAVYLDVWREAAFVGGAVRAGANGGFGWRVLERQSLLPQLGSLPYLDSMRPFYEYLHGDPTREWHNQPFLACAADKTAGAGWLHGVYPPPNSDALFDLAFSDVTVTQQQVHVGLPFTSYVELTSPLRKDPNGIPIMQGRLTVNRLDVYYKDAGGFDATVTSRYGLTPQYNSFDWTVTDTAYGKVTALRFNGRVLGLASNMVGVMPVATGTTSVFVGRESKDYVCKISSRDWMPLSITRVTWTGQWFMNHRFV